MSHPAPPRNIDTREPLAGEPAIRLALYLTDPQRRPNEFSAVTDQHGSVRRSDNPVAMVGSVIARLRLRLGEFGLPLPRANYLAKTFKADKSGKLIAGQLAAAQLGGPARWIEIGRKILCYHFLGRFYESALTKAKVKPDEVEEATWFAWDRIDRVLFREPDAAGVPRFFRGRRKSWSGAWSERELFFELERLLLHKKYLGERCELVMVSGDRAFPQTDRRWWARDQGFDAAADPYASTRLDQLTAELANLGVNIKFIFPSEGDTEAKESFNEFKQLDSSNVVHSIACPPGPPSFLTPAIQYIYLRAGDTKTLLILRGFDGGIPLEEQYAITVSATGNELRSFHSWLEQCSSNAPAPHRHGDADGRKATAPLSPNPVSVPAYVSQNLDTVKLASRPANVEIRSNGGSNEPQPQP